MVLNPKVAAIEFVGDEVRLAVVKTGGKAPTVLELHVATAHYEDPEGRFEAMVAAVDQALDKVEGNPAAYVYCAQASDCIVRSITIPFKGRRRVAAAVRFELEPYLAFPIEELMVDFKITSEADGQTEVLAMGMRRETLEGNLAILRAAGVEPDSVNLDALGISGLWATLNKGPRDVRALLHVRARGASLVIVENNKLAYFRHLPCTPEMIIESPRRVAREVQNTLRAYLAQRKEEVSIDTIHVTGVDFVDYERAAFAEALGLAVDETSLLPQLPGGAHALQDGTAGTKHNYWEAAVGVAACAAGGTGFDVDFRRAEQDMQGTLRTSVTHVLFSSVLAILLLLAAAVYYYQGTAKTKAAAGRVQAEIDQLNADILGLMEQGLGEGVNTDVFSDATLLELLEEIGKKMPEDKVTITEISANPPGARGAWITIEGQVGNSAVFNQIYNDLKTSELFRVEADPEIRMEGAETRFEIRAYRPTEETEDTPEEGAAG
jgi:hypothetical protein